MVTSMAKNQIHIEVAPRYLPEQSNPDEQLYVFAYTITLTNIGNSSAQLISRSWIVKDDSGHIDRVNGLGVVGQQPLLQPGESFEYTSGVHLKTPNGTMHGSYFFVTDEAERFDVSIPLFVLDAQTSAATAPTLH